MTPPASPLSRPSARQGESLGRFKAKIARDLRRLGVSEGDDLLVRAAAGRMQAPIVAHSGRVDAAALLLEALLSVVGASGTVSGLAFSSAEWRPWRRPSPPRAMNEVPNTGRFAQVLVSHPLSLRSTHPTNSFAAIGSGAGEMLRFHTPAAHCFRPVETLIERRGKMLLVGCTEQSPGFSTVHVAQYHLGLSHQSLMSKRYRARFIDSLGHERTYSKTDVPGCSMGFGRLYPRYREENLLVEGSVAGAESMIISAPLAYSIDMKSLIDDPTCVLCEDNYCVSCRATLTYAKREWGPYWRRRIALMIGQSMHGSK